MCESVQNSYESILAIHFYNITLYAMVHFKACHRTLKLYSKEMDYRYSNFLYEQHPNNLY